MKTVRLFTHITKSGRPPGAANVRDKEPAVAYIDRAMDDQTRQILHVAIPAPGM